MAFFQNLFDFEFRPTLFGADRQYQTGWKIKGNTNRSDYMLSGNSEPFNLTGNNTLTVNFAYDPSLVNYASVSITITATSLANVKAGEICNSLNSNPIFAELFLALVYPSSKDPQSPYKILIKGKRNRGQFRAYISNASAETIIKFNKNAPVAELPSLFKKYSISERFNWPDLGADRVILLDPSNPVDAAIISDAGFNPASPTPDWQLLAGSNDAYMFTKSIFTSGFLTEQIMYPAGAKAGYLAKKTFYQYDVNEDLVGKMETPYVLESGDLISP